MALLARFGSQLRRNISEIAQKVAPLAASSQKCNVYGIDDVLFGLTEDQIQVFYLIFYLSGSGLAT